jgi:hypothetical protein
LPHRAGEPARRLAVCGVRPAGRAERAGESMAELGIIDIDEAQLASSSSGPGRSPLSHGGVVLNGVTMPWPAPPDGARLPNTDGCACAVGGWCACAGVVGRIKVCSYLPLGLGCACLIGHACSPTPMPGCEEANRGARLSIGGGGPLATQFLGEIERISGPGALVHAVRAEAVPRGGSGKSDRLGRTVTRKEPYPVRNGGGADPYRRPPRDNKEDEEPPEKVQRGRGPATRARDAPRPDEVDMACPHAGCPLASKLQTQKVLIQHLCACEVGAGLATPQDTLDRLRVWQCMACRTLVRLGLGCGCGRAAEGSGLLTAADRIGAGPRLPSSGPVRQAGGRDESGRRCGIARARR